MDEFWRESFVARGIDGFDMMSYPLNAPITCRPDWRVPGERPGSDLGSMQRDALDAFGIGLAICNPLTGGQVAVSETMGAAICSAVNDWIIEHWLDKEPRLRASIVVPAQAPLLAAEEIERRAGGQAVRAGSAAGGVRDDARPQLLLADLRGGGEARSAGRPARRQHVPLRADLHRLAVVLSARLCRAVEHVRGSAAQPDLRTACSTSSPICAWC